MVLEVIFNQKKICSAILVLGHWSPAIIHNGTITWKLGGLSNPNTPRHSGETACICKQDMIFLFGKVYKGGASQTFLWRVIHCLDAFPLWPPITLPSCMWRAPPQLPSLARQAHAGKDSPTGTLVPSH